MTTTTDAPSLADRLAAAEAAAVEPRNRVSSLQNALTKAVSVGEYDRAAQIQAELVGAREDAATADAAAEALRDAAARIEQQRADDARMVAEARQRAQAERDLETARATERQGLGQLGDALDAMWNAVSSAQRFLRAALAAEHGVSDARRAQITARGQLGEWPAGHPGPTPAKCNTASLLANQDELVSVLARWSR
jgi:hypothetical protein